MQAPTVSIIICAYTEDRWSSLERGTRAALEQLGDRDELVLVVDHNDQLAARARRMLPAARVIENRFQRGLSGARNTGVDAATGEIVAFLDDDAVPDAGWLTALVSAMTDPSVVGVGGTAAPQWAASPSAWFPEEFLWVVGCSYRGLPETVHPVRNPIGASMAFRRDAITRAGGFATSLGRVGKTPLGCEETELSIRVLVDRPGDRILYVPRAVVRHEVTAERVSWRYFRARCFAEGLSKAAVSRMVGAEQGLSSERTYVTRTLPSGVVRALVRSPRRPRRAAAIVAGVMITTCGYARGRVSRITDASEQRMNLSVRAEARA